MTRGLKSWLDHNGGRDVSRLPSPFDAMTEAQAAQEIRAAIERNRQAGVAMSNQQPDPVGQKTIRVLTSTSERLEQLEQERGSVRDARTYELAQLCWEQAAENAMTEHQRMTWNNELAKRVDAGESVTDLFVRTVALQILREGVKV